jgi:hypothetical protein
MAANKNGDVKLELSEQELDYLKQIHNARALQELVKQPGWEIFQSIIARMVERLEDLHINFAGKATKDAYWASGLRLGAAREFAKILTETIDKEIGLLSQPLRPPQPPDPADFDGDILNNHNGTRPPDEN